MSRLTYTAGNHRYRLADTEGGKGAPVASVTTILKQLDKPALVNWAANQASGYAVDNWDRLTGMTPSQRLADISKQWRGVRDKAAATGTQLHSWADLVLSGQPVEIPDEYSQWVQGFADWWTSSGLTSVARECMIWSDADEVAGPAYAGRFDLYVSHPTRGRGLLDIKTGSGIYEEAAIQVAGYASAEWVVVPRDGRLKPDGGSSDSKDVPMPRVDWLGVVHTRPEGTALWVVPADMQGAAYEKWGLLRVLHGVPKIEINREIA